MHFKTNPLDLLISCSLETSARYPRDGRVVCVVRGSRSITEMFWYCPCSRWSRTWPSAPGEPPARVKILPRFL
jgi:hypothetical protein